MTKKTTKSAPLSAATKARIAKMKDKMKEAKLARIKRKESHDKFQKTMEVSHKDTLKSMKELYEETEKRKWGVLRRHRILKQETLKNMKKAEKSKAEVDKARARIEKQYRPDIEKAKDLQEYVLRSLVDVQYQIKETKRERYFQPISGLETHIEDMRFNKEDLQKSQNEIDKVLKDAEQKTKKFWAAFPSAIHPP